MLKSKLAMLLALCSLPMAATAQTQTRPPTITETDPDLIRIDEAHRTCTANVRGDLSDATCFSNAVAASDVVLNARWRTLLALPIAQNADVRRDLIAEQRAWVAFKERACGFYSRRPPFGTMHRDIFSAGCEGQIITDRIRQLNTIIVNLELQ